MTLFEYQAKRVERIAQALAYFIGVTQEDRLAWRPSAGPESDCRTVYQQVAECAWVNHALALLLSGRDLPSRPTDNGDPMAGFTGAKDAQDQIVSTGNELAAAIRGLSESDLERAFPHWRGPIMGETLIEMPYRNMAYHCGQINFIQTLYGDTEFHVPPTWI